MNRKLFTAILAVLLIASFFLPLSAASSGSAFDIVKGPSYGSSIELILLKYVWLLIPVSALKKFNTEKIIEAIVELLPEAPPYFPKDSLSDANERFFVSEIIREKIMLHYQQEIPYSVEVIVDAFKDEEKIVKIAATIFVERDSQKGILIGKGGEDIKRIGVESRIDIEKFLGKKVFLELFVKVEKEWRKNENKLRRFGYSL